MAAGAEESRTAADGERTTGRGVPLNRWERRVRLAKIR
jgi:hypothetical protein